MPSVISVTTKDLKSLYSMMSITHSATAKSSSKKSTLQSKFKPHLLILELVQPKQNSKAIPATQGIRANQAEYGLKRPA